MVVEATLQIAENRNEEKHVAIVAAAQKLFFNEGYEQTSMDRIAEQAGVSKQTIYSHFGNKETLFLAIMMSMCQTYGGGCPMEGLDLENTAPADVLCRLADHFVNIVTSPEGTSLFRLVIAEGQRNPKLASTFFENGPRQVVANIAEYLGMQHKNKTMHVPHPQKAAEQVFALIDGYWKTELLLSGKRLSKKEIALIKERIASDISDFIRLYEK